jgi:UDP-3-O-[3-hydroxymyristoyl] glucosamine N-acyltransferase
MPGPLSLEELAAAVQQRAQGGLSARLLGDTGHKVAAVAPLESAGGGDLSFLANPRYRRHAASTGAGALVLSDADRAALFEQSPGPPALVVCEAPYTWFAFAAGVLSPPAAVQPGRGAGAVVHADARIDPAASIGPQAVIEEGVEIGAGAQIGAACFLGAGVRVGPGTRLYPGVRVYPGCRIGARGIVHSGAVIGADGFGFAPFRGAWVKIPQTGAVQIGDDVEIGACTTIDRGAMGDTVIEDGVKIDNQVQIGHNCRIGAYTAIAGCVGIAGSAVIGRRCQLGGAAMIQGHITIADGSVISGATAITRDVKQPGFYTGIYPFMSNRQWERSAVLLRNLDELRERVRLLESKLRNRTTESDP